MGSEDNTRLFFYSFGKIYALYLQKIERKGRSKAELDRVIFWLTGHDAQSLHAAIADGRDLKTFFDTAPALNPNKSLITGVICGLRVEEISDAMVQNIRYLDKLVDELAKGKELEKILRHPK